MLLRLLPLATPANPSPLTILFTLPLPTHPYTSRCLPLPPALLSHRSLCLQEDIECNNVLLGERSSWVSGIIDDVTFSMPLSTIAVNFIDGTSVTMPITPACAAQLHRVVDEVHLSFAASSAAPKANASAAHSTPTAPSSSSTASPSKRTPSSLLLTLLSPLLASNNAPAPDSRPSLAAPPCAPARVHRRQARSLLVDTYRRHVLPVLKEQLPSAFLPWAIHTETTKQTEEFTQLRTQITELLANAGMGKTELEKNLAPLTRCRSSSASTASSLSADESDSEYAPSPVTPATSVFSRSACPTPPRQRPSPSPQAFLLSIPPAHMVPAQQRATYAAQLARLTQIASRISQVKKLGVRYEREEGKRKWLEGLERGRAVDKALRRAFSNGCTPRNASASLTAEPTKASRLWRSWTAEDEERLESTSTGAVAIHPAMMDCSSDEEGEDDDMPVTPQKSRVPTLDRPALGLTINLPVPTEIAEDFGNVVRIRRPSLEHTKPHSPRVVEETPGLVSSQSVESLVESYEWDRDGDATLLSPPPIGRHWQAVATTPSPAKLQNVKSAPLVIERPEEEDEDSYYGHCQIYA